VVSARRSASFMRRSASSSLYRSSSPPFPGIGASVPKRIPNPPRRCIFCDATGITKEHMWADWLRDYIARPRSRHAIQLETIGLTGDAETIIKEQTGDPHSRRIKCVCGPCNSGWMSGLQGAAKPFLVPALSGQPVTLRRNGQTALAAWTAMFVMVAEHLDLHTVTIPTADRQWLRSNIRPPSHWRIWIGQHSATSHPLFSHNALSFRSQRGNRATWNRTSCSLEYANLDDIAWRTSSDIRHEFLRSTWHH
jgi:hypothetical protein